MSKGLFHCSTCKSHFYDAEATQMHIRDKHNGKGEVLRHPTKKELLVRAEADAARIAALTAERDALREALRKADNALAEIQDFKPEISYPSDSQDATVVWMEAAQWEALLEDIAEARALTNGETHEGITRSSDTEGGE